MCSYVHVVPGAICLYVFPCPLAGINQWASTLLMEMSMTNVRRLVSKKELKGVLGIPYCPAHIARLEAAGEFPLRVKLGQCRVAWYLDEVVEWIESKARSRMAKPSH